jgi:hypothetical protein
MKRKAEDLFFVLTVVFAFTVIILNVIGLIFKIFLP